MGGPTLTQAAWFLPAVIPIGLFVAYSDLSRMKIPNVAVYALVIGFAVLGLAALPLEVWLWRWTHFAVVLIVGMVLNAVGAFGAGDAKFLAAAAPFVALSDLSLIFYLLAGSFIAGWLAHRIAKHSPLRRIAPNWQSWESGKRFPMGFPLAMALILYLLIPVFRTI
ncbi:prepilin peptidase [Marivivens marinus]|uniref:prepilin peptidase n=1 Tax=Marivivens marinus TaxID=3110173 RepID=UPI003B8484FD